jgi:acylphosphatase
MGGERRRYIFRGRVQGVGFRATAEQLARDHDVTGFVRNQPDGSVELVAEGEPTVIDTFVAQIRQAFGTRIHEARFEPGIPSGSDPSFPDFRIRH